MKVLEDALDKQASVADRTPDKANIQKDLQKDIIGIETTIERMRRLETAISGHKKSVQEPDSPEPCPAKQPESFKERFLRENREQLQDDHLSD